MSGFVLGRDGGDTYAWRGAEVQIKASAAATLGQLGVMEFVYPPGLAVPTHHHEGEDEMFYVLDGELRGRCDDDEWTATPGTFVFVPRDRPHSFTVVGADQARALVITGPSNLAGQVVAGGVRLR
jgi:quercetin dioxygenase-like cupin family protein